MESLKMRSVHPLTEDRLRAVQEMVKRQEKVRKNEKLAKDWEAIENALNEHQAAFDGPILCWNFVVA
ncbi:putative Zn-dependent protease [Dyadobacter sp. BE34]|uniref:Zn-dependent protease n=1 Tax=Dyadobacter fermentans TaxID=94254 RepID=A0ABU1QQQ6_9BACT|nr:MULTISPECIES: hypothetical protein [Dyadobacter]MDR6803472.1 putative Zn-dependent protease [Dyadobacter fermentans]MDR7041213.1 putative Zn-dependent protease [Dyadobacter sp. BE242]MDR7195616.1 putative Zn-dependent protease [Dyadobacter sp. BE34]MDR7213839.1 putative Zn-dependent protease [Dyadobacter sp. BE31]MDR7261023.1 putative Zn-dependent protease [Dyadobacter sp. BE32]